MTRPIELKPREDESRGTLPEEYVVGTELPAMPFTVTPEIIDEYIAAVDADRSLYQIDGRPAAPPNVLAIYLLATIYRRYPPIQGIILTDVAWQFHHPIWADEHTCITACGRIEDKLERRGKHFVCWSASFRRHDGQSLAEARNTMYVPSQRYEKR